MGLEIGQVNTMFHGVENLRSGKAEIVSFPIFRGKPTLSYLGWKLANFGHSSILKIRREGRSPGKMEAQFPRPPEIGIV